MDQLIAVLVGAVGPTGGLLWFMYHTTVKTIPDMVALHRVEVAGLVESFRVDLKEERELRETLLSQLLKQVAYTCPYSAARQSEKGPLGGSGKTTEQHLADKLR